MFHFSGSLFLTMLVALFLGFIVWGVQGAIILALVAFFIIH